VHRYRITSTRNDREREFFSLSLQKAIATMNKIVDEENMINANGIRYNKLENCLIFVGFITNISIGVY
jgi:hypothetical protein